MTVNNKLERRFLDLESQLVLVANTKQYRDGSFSGDYVDSEMFTNWRVKARHLLSVACGDKSEHYRDLVEKENNPGWSTNYQNMLQLKAIFEAAREDFKEGLFRSVRNLVRAELFDSELEQARELLSSGYKIAAAVIAGIVLETELRQLCQYNQVSVGKLDKMNADLAKKDVHTVLTQKRITALADIRNNAAHGHAEMFNDSDVKDMILEVESFISDHL